MSERITEAELAKLAEFAGMEKMASDDPFGQDREVLRLIAEVRRLRGLIAAAYDSHDVNLTLLNLLTEAEAIRKEQASLDKRV